VVRQLVARGLLAVEGNYNTFVLTGASRPVLRSEQQVMLRRDPPKAAKPARTRAAKGSRPQAAELPAESAGTFERLRAWRGEVARQSGLPAYVIFHDATLREIAARVPTSLAELATVSGVGQSKLAKYGQDVLTVLAEDAGLPQDPEEGSDEPLSPLPPAD
jgi:ATP-dependent DNA helicase RecQ